MIHIYEGGGKGKTTAAYGLCARAIGHNKSVKICGFIKPETTGEYMFFKDKADISYYGGKYGFVGKMCKEDEECCKKEIREGFFKAVCTPCFLLVLDEILDAVNFGFLTEKEVCEGVLSSPAEEIVLTGRNPKKAICDIADYYTYFEKRKHPYDKGITARKGIEF